MLGGDDFFWTKKMAVERLSLHQWNLLEAVNFLDLEGLGRLEFPGGGMTPRKLGWLPGNWDDSQETGMTPRKLGWLLGNNWIHIRPPNCKSSWAHVNGMFGVAVVVFFWIYPDMVHEFQKLLVCILPPWGSNYASSTNLGQFEISCADT